MIIGIPKETKVKENRVSCTPDAAQLLIQHGHEVLVERNAGHGSGYEDELYEQAGCRILDSAEDVWAAEMVIKIKEPIESEYPYLREGLILFTYLHLAANRPLTERLLESKTTAIAYETIEVDGRLPLLEPMSEIAGRMSTIVGAYYLSKAQGGKGILLGGVRGVRPGKVLILGGGIAGVNAGRVAVGIGADVTLLEVNLEKIRLLDHTLGSAQIMYSNEQNISALLPEVDLLIGAVLVHGAKAPKLIKREMLGMMKKGSVLVDIAIDQGGCAESSRITTHEDPVYEEKGVIHYCVANMPGAYARTATQALTNVTMPYALKIADFGAPDFMIKVPELIEGVNTWQGKLSYKAVADAHNLEYTAMNQPK